MLVKAAINGGRTRAEHAAVPLSPEEQAAAVVGCLKAGAGAIHLHVRVTSASTSSSTSTSDSINAHWGSRENGRQDVCAPSEGATGFAKESLYPEDVARTILAVRSVSPEAEVGVSTGAWILPGTAARFEAVAAWEVLPDFASVNFIEDGAVELARLLLSRGVGVEAGLSDADAAEVFVRSGLAASCLRVLLEPQEQEIERALANVNAIEKLLAAGPAELSLRPPRLLHGTEATAWPMMDEAIARGYAVRVGLEDTLVMPDGRIARDNSELVTEAVRRVGEAVVSGQ